MNVPFLIVSALLGVVALICARGFVFYVKREGLDKEERMVLPISIAFFVAFGIGVCFAIAKQDISDYSSDILPIYAMILAFCCGFALIMNGAYKTAGRLSVFTGLSLGIAIGMIIFYNYFIALGVIIIISSFAYMVTRYIESVKNNV